MRKIEENFIESWELVRKNGRNRYALRTGVLWSIFTAFLTKVFELSVHSFEEVYFSKSFLNYLALFILVGIVLFWQFIWKFNEKRYYILKKKKEDESNS
ncbi:hypothetical protein [Lutibacter sp.]|uniref:hypothetical protein n=1 Tax=Lutibacter sp. TaxID=1925666 RepID=UPI001A1E2173|nr:hypothetical protein [Lutibacter sp.]MBI9041239.1 hypothetical protein [Lutibacter sp.]